MEKKDLEKLFLYAQGRKDDRKFELVELNRHDLSPVTKFDMTIKDLPSKNQIVKNLPVIITGKNPHLNLVRQFVMNMKPGQGMEELSDFYTRTDCILILMKEVIMEKIYSNAWKFLPEMDYLEKY